MLEEAGTPDPDLMQACPEDVSHTAIAYDNETGTCVETTAHFEDGDFVSTDAEIFESDRCCERGIATDTTPASLAESLVMACEPEIEYNCDADPCTKTTRTPTANGEGATDDVTINLTADDNEEVCQVGIELEDPSLRTQCRAPDTVTEVKYDEDQNACFNEVTQTFYDGTEPSIQHEANVVGLSVCCDEGFMEACDNIYSYNGSTCSLTVGTSSTNMNKEDCCLEGWDIDSAELKAACEISTTTFSYDNVQDRCTLSLIDITPNYNNEKTTPVDNQDCCNNANGDNTLLGACPADEQVMEFVVYETQLTWDAARQAC